MRARLFALAFGFAVLVQPAYAQEVPRHVIVNGNVGLAGREIAFLILTNLEQEPVIATVQIVGEAGPIVAKPFALQPESRLPINLAVAFTNLDTHFSVSVVFESADSFGFDVATAAAMVWYRAADLPRLFQVDEAPAVIIRSTKR